MAARRTHKQKPAVVAGPVEIPDAEHELVIERVAAIDVAKAAGSRAVSDENVTQQGPTPRHQPLCSIWSIWRALLRWFRAHAVIVTAVLMLAAVAFVARAAYARLDEPGLQAVSGKVVELSLQFFVVVLLGALLKKAIDDAQERRAAQAAHHQMQSGFVHRLVDASHNVDLARVLIHANRSVKTWSEQMNECVTVAYIDLRDIRHDVNTAQTSGTPVFTSWTDKIERSIGTMESFLKKLIDEFADRKKELAELQLDAEGDRKRQSEVWDQLKTLPRLGDLLFDRGDYTEFRKAYKAALSAMRADMADTSTSER